MAVNKHKAVFVVTYLCLALLLCMLTSQAEAKVTRFRRQECQDGTYEHEGRKCCKCPAGSRVENHCTDQLQTMCEPCVAGQYQSHANQETTCDRCTSCTHLSANLEVDKNCTRFVDSTCKCKKDHYFDCPSGKTPCDVCEPCQKCGPEREKVACSATNNTICNEKPPDQTPAIALGIIIPLVIVAGLAAAVYFLRKKRKSASRTIENGNVEFYEVTVPLQPVDAPVPAVILRPYIPEIAEEIGWKTMRNLAMNSKIPTGRIESCELDHQDGVERTIALLKIWEEKEGKNASTKLIQYLRNNNQNTKAEEVLKILRAGSS